MGQKHKRFRKFWTPIILRVTSKNPRSRYAHVSKVMAQFVLKIENLSHIMGPAPILEMARAYDLRPRLWLLVRLALSDQRSAKYPRPASKTFRPRNRTTRPRSSILFSFASLTRIENISIISTRDKKQNKLWREPPAMIKFIYKSLRHTEYRLQAKEYK